jgi:hypothetical protein
MSELRIDSHRLNQVAELIILWRTRGYKFRDELEKPTTVRVPSQLPTPTTRSPTQ